MTPNGLKITPSDEKNEKEQERKIRERIEKKTFLLIFLSISLSLF